MCGQGGEKREILWSQRPANLAVWFAAGSVRDLSQKWRCRATEEDTVPTSDLYQHIHLPIPRETNVHTYTCIHKKLKNQKTTWNCLMHKHSYLFTSWSNNKLWFTLSNLFFLDRQLFLTSMSPFIHERSPSPFFSPRRGWLRRAARERFSFQSAQYRKIENRKKKLKGHKN